MSSHSRLYVLIIILVLFMANCEEEREFTPNHYPIIHTVGQVEDGVYILGTATLTCMATDEDGDSLTYTWVTPIGSLSGSGNTVTWEAPYQAALYPFYCVVDDGLGGITEREFQVQVFSFDSAHWLVFDPEDYGIRQAYQISISAASNGHIWTGDMQGFLSRFDGNQWSSWDLSAGDIVSVDVDSQHRVWIGSEGQPVTIFDGVTSSVPDPPVFGPRLSVGPNDQVWVGSTLGLSHYDGAAWTHYNPGNSQIPFSAVRVLNIDHSGIVWFADEYLVSFDGSSFITHPAIRPASEGSIAFDNHNQVWVAQTENLMHYDGDAWVEVALPIQGSHLGSLVFDENDVLWYGFYGGLGRYDGENWTLFTPENSPIPNSDVMRLTTDSFGNKWLCTLGGGVVALGNHLPGISR